MSMLISKKMADKEIYLLYQPPHQSHTMPSLMRFSGSATRRNSPRSTATTGKKPWTGSRSCRTLSEVSNPKSPNSTKASSESLSNRSPFTMTASPSGSNQGLRSTSTNKSRLAHGNCSQSSLLSFYPLWHPIRTLHPITSRNLSNI